MRWLVSICCISLMMTGCATKRFVSGEIESSEKRTSAQVEDLKRLVEESQTEIRSIADELDLKIEGFEQNTEDLSRIAKENSELIVQLGQLRFQKTLSESEANFESDSSILTPAAMAELDKFAELILRQNKLVHLEIQGHTDSRGTKDYNLKLGETRARSVREYLYKKHDLPLHLMNIISYGPDKPIADNSKASGRAMNRRVVMVVRLQI